MKPFVKKLLWVLFTPIVIALLALVTARDGMEIALSLLCFVVPAYLVVGLILLLVSGPAAETGKALMLASGIILLVGLSTCGLMLATMN